MDAAVYYSWMVIVSTASALVALISAAFAVSNTWKSWRQARRPNIVLFLQPRHGDITIMDVVVANIGQGAAREISFHSHFAREVNESGLRTENLWVPGKNGMTTLPFMVGNSKLEQPIGVSWSMLKNPEIWPLTVVVNYWDASKSQKLSDTFHLDPKSYAGFIQLGSPPLVKIADALDKLQKKVGDFGFSDRLRVEAIVETLAEYSERREAEIKDIKEAMAVAEREAEAKSADRP